MMVLGSILLVVMQHAAAAPQVFHVRDFGAEAVSVEDSGPAIRRAIAAAIAHDGLAIVQLAEGAYRVAPESGTRDALPIQGADGLTLRGRGASTRLIITDPSVGAIRLDDCREIRISDLSIDYDPLPYAQGTVVAVAEDDSYFDLACDPGYLEPNASAFSEAQAPWGLVISTTPSGDERFGPIPVWAKHWSPLGEGRWRCTADSRTSLRASGVRPGARYVHMARRYVASGLVAWSCSGVTLDRVTIHAAPATATMWGLNEDVTMRGLRVARPAESGRLLSTNADGIHCLGQRGTLLIEDCSFEAMADDAINIHARAGTVLSQAAPNRLLVQTSGTVTYRPGDELQIYDPDGGQVRYGGVMVRHLESSPESVVLTLDRSVEGVRTGASFSEGDHIFNLSACGTGAVIRRNHFGNHRGRAILLKTAQCRVEKNEFKNREGWGITLHQLQDWGEGPAAHDIQIIDNRFEGMGTGAAPCIDIRPTRRDGAPADGRPARNIRVERNTFINPVNGILRAWAVHGLHIVGNTVRAAAGTRGHDGPLIALHEGADIAIVDLSGRDNDPKTTAAILIGTRVDPDTLGVRIHGLHAEMLPGVPLVLDERP
jgi:parallel beta helix pectate lyase-like protein